ncbi:MAG: FAD-binding and (Fe-S)-binding domain-containing protein [Rothia sp. (in: high G+C Gram-positive bacteria)]|uniref:FAD-binding and (Fe-S)-binding domain-containing protein n=1 Tax=Rothia sp. (in: high G+C Gram-positive bacteria) TaxID=1885016 RepID=UPI0026DEA7AE|nr:FAD-binding and (Fe-S)-binding domain-containing protein [Rothia sp. (in: high G+C Gram-positive bacteria)]MDO5750697.1 FAD-binding and (Fe-S)-binding domain-containing protein [Rothia sp. (in: high G+C Gram-positive bacteria)]
MNLTHTRHHQHQSPVTNAAAALHSPYEHTMERLFAETRAGAMENTRSALDRLALSHDASHYQLVPAGILRPASTEAVADIFRAASALNLPLTFRSGGTSLSGQASTDALLVDTRKHFRSIEVLDEGRRVRVGPGATVMAVNNRLAAYGRKLGPDPASWSACTIGGVVANNSSGMSSGTEYNTYNTLESMVFILPSGTVIDTADPNADSRLKTLEPEIHEGLVRLRRRVLDNPESMAIIAQQYSMKNTMGYGLNSLVDYEKPVDILAHLMIGSEGTLGFVASAIYRTLPIFKAVSTGLLVFDNLIDATRSVPELVAHKLATVELLDATSISVAQRTGQAAQALAAIDVRDHAALLVEFQGNTQEELAELAHEAAPMFASLPVVSPVEMTSQLAERNALWQARRGLYTTVAGNRPTGTNALLEDVVVPVDVLGETCQELTSLFNAHGYKDSVIFGHAKDGNIHFMLNEQFTDPKQLVRYREFTEDMVQLILGAQGSLKAEHGTGRIMAPFVRRQFGDELYSVMEEIKRLIDPVNFLNPGVLIADQSDYAQDLKVAAPVEEEINSCVECGYCEPVCPSKDLTLTPRQRIVLRREINAARLAGNTELAEQLEREYEYYGIDTCAVDSMCATRCPLGIDTGNFVRTLRAQNQDALGSRAWSLAAKHWSLMDRGAGVALSVAKHLPAGAVKSAAEVARVFFGEDLVPTYKRELSAGGVPRRPHADSDPEIVFFPACVNAMFGGVDDSGTSDNMNATRAFMTLCDRAGIGYVIPEGISSLCCGTPWKSKGYTEGYSAMSDKTLAALWEASDHGRLPIVCDASSCTEGLQVMQAKVAHALAEQLGRDAAGIARGDSEPDYASLVIIDAVSFAADNLLECLEVTAPIESLAVHPTCSMVHLGIQGDFEKLAAAVSDELYVPAGWGCCGYAGDRGLLHPELTASATRAEAAEISAAEQARSGRYRAYASSNRTCEQGMSEATSRSYQNILQILERATR